VIAPLLFAATTFSTTALANAAAVAQATDCTTTRRVMAMTAPYHPYERNPIARTLGSERSLPLCLVEAAAFNFAIRRNRTAVGITLAVEAAAVANNVRVLLRWNVGP